MPKLKKELSTHDLHAMDEAALMQFANDRFGIALDADDKIGMVAELETMLNEIGEDVAPKTKNVATNQSAKSKKVKVVFAETNGPDGANDVVLQFEGVAYQVKKNHPVDLPLDVLRACVDLAVQTEFYQEGDEIKSRDIPRFNYRIIGDVA